MAGEEVREETQGQRDGARDEGGEELQRDDQRKQVSGDAVRDERVLHELAETELGDAGADVHEPGHDREGVGVTDVGERRVHEQEELSEPVVHQQEREECKQVREELAEVCVENVASHTIADELIDVFEEELTLRRLYLELAGTEVPEGDHEDRGDDGLQERLVDPVREDTWPDRVPLEIVCARGLVTAAAFQRNQTNRHLTLPYRFVIR